MRPAAGRRVGLRGPRPRSAPRPDTRSRRLRSRPARCDIRAASPGRRAGRRYSSVPSASPPDRVAGAIETRARRAEWVWHEPLSREFRALPVAEGHAGAADVEFAGHAHGTGCLAAVEHVDLGVGDRPADRDDCRRPRLHLCRPSTRWWSRSDRTDSRPRGRASRELRPDRAASASPPHRARNPASPLQPLSRSSLQVAGVACITVAPLEASSVARRGPSTATSRLAMTTPAAGDERKEQLEPGDVERERRDGDEHVVGRQARFMLHRGEEVHDCADAAPRHPWDGRSIPTCRSDRPGRSRSQSPPAGRLVRRRSPRHPHPSRTTAPSNALNRVVRSAWPTRIVAAASSSM